MLSFVFLLLSVVSTNALDLTKAFLENPGLARRMAKVDHSLLNHKDAAAQNTTSYSGFLHTSESKNMFFWYFPAQNPVVDNVPLLIWLQGGPGGSSLFGLFNEMGPYSVTEDLELVSRDITWNTKYDMLFIDNPVGAGFSYTTSKDGYCNDTKNCVASNLYSLLQQFYVLFPEKLDAPLYITGESYAGHYVPAISYYIHQRNIGEEEPCMLTEMMTPCVPHIPLAGLAIGDGWVDPVNQMTAYPGLFYNFGLADDRELAQIQNYTNTAIAQIKAGQMYDAFVTWDEMLNGDVFPYPSYFKNITGSTNYDNFLKSVGPPEFAYYAKYLSQPKIKAAIHAGDAEFGTNAHECELHLLEDFHRSFAPELTTLLNYKDNTGYSIIVYSGQLDIIIGSALTQAFLRVLDGWEAREAYLASSKEIWKVDPSDTEVAGFWKKVDNFSYVIVRRAGHISPFDQPRAMAALIDRMVDRS